MDCLLRALPRYVPLLISAPNLVWRLLTQVEKALAKSSQVFLEPLLILSTQGYILAMVWVSVESPEMPGSSG